MKKKILDLFGPEKSPEEIYAFATEPTEDDLELFHTGEGYQSAEWQAWFERYFKHSLNNKYPIKSTLEDQKPKSAITIDSVKEPLQEFQSRFPHLMASMREYAEQMEQAQVPDEISAGEVWSLEIPAGVFRSKPVVIAQPEEDYFIGLPLTWQEDELWYAHDQDLILQPDDWSQSYPAFISTWNPQILLKTQFHRRTGKLTEKARQEMLFAFGQAKPIQIPQERLKKEKKFLQDILIRLQEIQSRILERQKVSKSISLYGKPILSQQDPRNRYALNEWKLCAYMSVPFIKQDRPLLDSYPKTQHQAKVIHLNDYLPRIEPSQHLSNNFWEFIQHARSEVGQGYHRQLVESGLPVQPEKMAAASEKADEEHPLAVTPLTPVAQDMEIHLNPANSDLKIVIGGEGMIERVEVTGEPDYHWEKSFDDYLVTFGIPFHELKGIETLFIRVICHTNEGLVTVHYPDIALP